MKLRTVFAALSVGLASTSLVTSAAAQDVAKVGVVLPLTGPFTSTGRQVLNGAQLYLRQHGDTFGDRKIELIIKDDAAVADHTKRIVQEMIVNDGVSVVAGFGLTQLALAAAPLATRSRTPMVVMAGAASSVTDASPMIARTSFTQAASPYVLAGWMAENGIKSVVTLVSDFGPGYEAETVFSGRFQQEGGEVLQSLRVPLQSPDFAPFLQRARDARPDAVFVFIPAGQASTMFRQFVERGLKEAGIQIFGAGDVTDDDVLVNIGDSAIGTVTAHHYSASHDSQMNADYVAAYTEAFGMRPNFFSLGGYDGMHLIASALEQTDGDTDGKALIEAMAGMAWESPRGPLVIDQETRDVVNNIYMRRVEKIDGELWNTEFETIEMVKDPIKSGLTN